ncbi:uncharacterized protein B0I36DRAFT_362373 [Microdochium trichocladiopsis]|uniref:GLEYA adhesin domain-containing protein n=1 Tax=Microdochium trichocladiopsis TaxID=1682393 RepID=A0A9P8YAH0_9PEZI|nr:uncharacterized protein B0I36DRAFT_362373 [Microdochium trichocladiopsis]KAH7033740.1 hypothetical protein B0I36DRAFT_362373 [Microdochium trichocladiopsis]
MRFTTACVLPTVGFAVLASAACVRKSSSSAQIYPTVSATSATSSDITASSLSSSITSITSSADVTVSSSTLTSSTTSSVPYCSSVSSYFAADGGAAAATSFCSSYLGMPLQTATVTATATTQVTLSVTSGTTTLTETTTGTAVPATSTSTVFVTAISTSTIVTTVSGPFTSSITSCVAPTTTITITAAKRLAATSASGAIDDYTGTELSKACGCFGFTESTTTVTVTATDTTQTVATMTVPLSETETTAITPATTYTNTITNTMTVALVATTIQTTTVYTTTTYVLAVPTFSLRARYTDTGSGSPRTDQAIMMPSPYGQAQFYPLGTPPGSMISQFRQPAAGEMDSIGRTIDPGALIGLVSDGSVRYLYTENTGLRFTVYGNTISQPYHGVVCTLITLPSSAGFDGTCPLTCKGWAGTTSFDWLENQSPAASRWNIAGDGTAQQYGGIFVPYAVSP